MTILSTILPAKLPKRHFFIFAVMGVFFLSFIQLPLFNYLGYEYSAVCAIILPFLIGPVVIKMFRNLAVIYPDSFSTAIKETYRHSFRFAGILLLIPFLIATLNIFIVKNCSYGEGLLFFVLIPVITSFLSISVGIFCAMLFRRAMIFYFIILTFDLLHPLYLGYYTPAIYSYNLIYGYFPGFSYDEVLTISSTLVLFRGITVLCSLLFVLCSLIIAGNAILNDSLTIKLKTLFLPPGWNILHAMILAIALILVFVWIKQERLGFVSTNNGIEDELSGIRRTEHFNIKFAPGSFTHNELEYLAKEHEFRLFQEKRALHVNFKGIINSYIYPNTEIKRRYIGAGTTNIAKPWRNEIHLNKDSWQEVLKHELVHVVAGEFGLPLIKAHYNIGLTEGLATGIDNDWGNRTLHEYAAAMKKFSIAPNPEKLISPGGFMSQSSGLSYVLMGSFCKYLVDTFGIEKFKLVYSGSSPEQAYGKSYELLLGKWNSSLQQIQVPETWREHVEYYFKRSSIFAKECARAIARINQEGFRKFSLREPAEAKKLFEQSLAYSWNSAAFSGLMNAEYFERHYASVINFMNDHSKAQQNKSSSASLSLIYGNALWATGDTATAQHVFRDALTLDLSDNYNESAALRLEALKDSSIRNVLRPYFTSNLTGLASLTLIDSAMRYSQNPLLSYLKAKILFRIKRYKEIPGYLQPLTPLPSSLLESAKNELLGETFFWLKDFQKAGEYFSTTLQLITNKASRMRIEDWIQRCEWWSRHKGEMWE